MYNPSDSKCFLWSVLAGLVPDITKKYQVSYYKQFGHTLNMTGLEFPVQPKCVDKFEALNPNISINIFGYESDKVYPIWINKKTVGRSHANLLLLTDDKGKLHNCIIAPVFHDFCRT